MPIFAAELRHGWKALIGWTLGLVAVCVIYLPFFESIGASMEMKSMLDSLPQTLVVGMGIDLMFSGAGYVHSSILEMTALILVVIAGVGWGARAVAGDEEEGMLELTLAHGVSRTRVYAERALAIVARFLILGAALWAILMGSSGPFSLDLDAGDTTAGVASFTALAIALSFVSLAVGAATGRKSAAIGAGAGLAVAAYIANVIGRQSQDWGWLSDVSPLGWAFAEVPIMNGWDVPGLALLGGLAALSFVLGLLAVTRRDILG
ncbi:MAG TPA: ABC transporter permease subunit [Arachnia sp.]|nr:ABC transporter permease subunit [Arachnia sp.]HMT85708.1 ABC transporter permease subunit [Arachnia sp.]